jgi:hypothetical protein
MDYKNQLFDKYLKPNKDPHIRVGKEYQAVIPNSNEVIPHTNIVITETLTIEEEVEIMKKPHKKKKVD